MSEATEMTNCANDPVDSQVSNADIGRYFVPKLQGARYYSVLAAIHEALKPDSYLEVGIRQGHSLALAKCAAIGIDPRFELTVDAREGKPALHLFTTTSDKFFKETNPCSLLEKDHIDFFFLDGAHYADYLLRDFFNSERHAAKNSVIAMHDCIPIDIAMTLSPQQRKESPYPIVYPGLWSGDCWRVIMMLKKYRPDVRMYCIDSQPTGLVLLTNLDRKSDILSKNYNEIVEEMNALDLATIGLRSYIDNLPVLSTDEFIGAANISKRLKPWNDEVLAEKASGSKQHAA